MDGALSGSTQPLRIAVAACGQGLELAEGPGSSLEKQVARLRHREGKKRSGPAEVHQVQAIRTDAGGNGEIQRVVICGAVAQDGKVNIASHSRLPPDARPEEHQELEIRCACSKAGELLGHEFCVHGSRHDATVSEWLPGVKKGAWKPTREGLRQQCALHCPVVSYMWRITP